MFNTEKFLLLLTYLRFWIEGNIFFSFYESYQKRADTERVKNIWRNEIDMVVGVS